MRLPVIHANQAPANQVRPGVPVLGSDLIAAAQLPHAQVLTTMHQAGADLSLREADGGTLLMAAAKAGAREVVAYLLQHGNAQVNAEDNQGRSALHHACMKGHSEVVSLLVTQRADGALKDNLGATAGSLAAGAGHVETVACLLKLHAMDVNARDYRHKTALHDASEQGQKSLVKVFLAAHANVDLLDADGNSALMLAIHARQPKIVKLLAASAALEETNREGLTPLDLAASKGCHGSLMKLLEAQAVLSKPVACDVYPDFHSALPPKLRGVADQNNQSQTLKVDALTADLLLYPAELRGKAKAQWLSAESLCEVSADGVLDFRGAMQANSGSLRLGPEGFMTMLVSELGGPLAACMSLLSQEKGTGRQQSFLKALVLRDLPFPDKALAKIEATDLSKNIKRALVGKFNSQHEAMRVAVSLVLESQRQRVCEKLVNAVFNCINAEGFLNGAFLHERMSAELGLFSALSAILENIVSRVLSELRQTMTEVPARIKIKDLRALRSAHIRAQFVPQVASQLKEWTQSQLASNALTAAVCPMASQSPILRNAFLRQWEVLCKAFGVDLHVHGHLSDAVSS